MNKPTAEEKARQEAQKIFGGSQHPCVSEQFKAYELGYTHAQNELERLKEKINKRLEYLENTEIKPDNYEGRKLGLIEVLEMLTIKDDQDEKKEFYCGEYEIDNGTMCDE